MSALPIMHDPTKSYRGRTGAARARAALSRAGAARRSGRRGCRGDLELGAAELAQRHNPATTQPPGARNPLRADQAAWRCGMSTTASAATTRASAAKSLHCGRSPSTSIPLNTPTIGIIKVESEETLIGAWVAILIHAQLQKIELTIAL